MNEQLNAMRNKIKVMEEEEEKKKKKKKIESNEMKRKSQHAATCSRTISRRRLRMCP